MTKTLAAWVMLRSARLKIKRRHDCDYTWLDCKALGDVVINHLAIVHPYGAGESVLDGLETVGAVGLLGRYNLAKARGLLLLLAPGYGDWVEQLQLKFHWAFDQRPALHARLCLVVALVLVLDRFLGHVGDHTLTTKPGANGLFTEWCAGDEDKDFSQVGTPCIAYSELCR